MSTTEELIEQEIQGLVSKYGVVPPGWYMFPDLHPYSIGWRMGAGEWHAWAFYTWWEREKDNMNEEQRIMYFRWFPPPPRWLMHMIELLWDIDAYKSRESGGEFDHDPYFRKAEELGFGTKEQWNQGLNGVSNNDSDGEEEVDNEEIENQDQGENIPENEDVHHTTTS